MNTKKKLFVCLIAAVLLAAGIPARSLQKTSTPVVQIPLKSRE